MTGTFLLATRGNIHSLSISTLGLIFGIGAGITNASYTIIPVKLLQKYDSKLVCGWAMFIGSFPLMPFAATQSPHTITTAFVYEMLFIVIIGTMLAYLFFITSINYLSPAITGVLGAFEPLSATLLSVIMLGLVLHPVDLIGGGLILLMAILQSLPDKQPLKLSK
ncbi:EamA family transporter [Lactobacillaceae bacterium Melli_B4]